MSRLVFGMLFLFGLTFCSVTVGCGDGGNEVIEDTRSETEIQASDDDYEASMEAGEAEAAGDS